MTSSTLPFDLAYRGYARNQVDAYLAEVEVAFAENAKRVDELEQDVARLRRQLADHDSPGPAGVGARLAEMLRLAEEEAERLRRDAHREGDQIVADARARAAQIVATAADDADTIRRDAETEADKRRAEIDADRRELDRRRALLDDRVAALRAALGRAASIQVEEPTAGTGEHTEDAGSVPDREQHATVARRRHQGGWECGGVIGRRGEEVRRWPPP